MTTEEAVEICKEWFRYIERQEAKTKRMQELAALARTGPEGHAEAKRQMRKIDRQPKVYDGGRLQPAVEHLVSVVEEQK